MQRSLIQELKKQFSICGVAENLRVDINPITSTTMKKKVAVLVVVWLALIGGQAFAQKIGIQGGINLSNILAKDDEDTYSDDFEMNLGFNGGVTVEVGLGDLLSVEAAIMADSKGFKMKEDFLGTEYTTKANLLYVDVPVLVKVGPTFGPVKVFGAAGPYIGYGISGKFKFEADGESETEDVEWGDTEDDFLKRMDFGAKFGAGLEVMGFTLGAYYSLGLANVSPVTEDGAKINHRVISISAGYKIGK